MCAGVRSVHCARPTPDLGRAEAAWRRRGVRRGGRQMPGGRVPGARGWRRLMVDGMCSNRRVVAGLVTKLVTVRGERLVNGGGLW